MNRALVFRVRELAEDRCDYCRMPAAFDPLPFQVDHIVAQQHGGQTVLENLAWRVSTLQICWPKVRQPAAATGTDGAPILQWEHQWEQCSGKTDQEVALPDSEDQIAGTADAFAKLFDDRG